MTFQTYMFAICFVLAPLRSLPGPLPAGWSFSFLLVRFALLPQVTSKPKAGFALCLGDILFNFLNKLGNSIMGRQGRQNLEMKLVIVLQCVFSLWLPIPHPPALLNFFLESFFLLLFKYIVFFLPHKLWHLEVGRRHRRLPDPAHWTWNQIFKLSMQDFWCLLARVPPFLAHSQSKCFKDFSSFLSSFSSLSFLLFFFFIQNNPLVCA